jgi:hypothetical protein
LWPSAAAVRVASLRSELSTTDESIQALFTRHRASDRQLYWSIGGSRGSSPLPTRSRAGPAWPAARRGRFRSMSANEQRVRSRSYFKPLLSFCIGMQG